MACHFPDLLWGWLAFLGSPGNHIPVLYSHNEADVTCRVTGFRVVGCRVTGTCRLSCRVLNPTHWITAYWQPPPCSTTYLPCHHLPPCSQLFFGFDSFSVVFLNTSSRSSGPSASSGGAAICVVSIDSESSPVYIEVQNILVLQLEVSQWMVRWSWLGSLKRWPGDQEICVNVTDNTIRCSRFLTRSAFYTGKSLGALPKPCFDLYSYCVLVFLD